MYLALIETAGNQEFIFDSNRVRHQVGASQLILEVGTDWVLSQLTGLAIRAPARTEERAGALLAQEPLSISDGADRVEVVVATSGKALLLSNSRDALKAIVSKVTSTALRRAVGLDVAGVIVEFDWSTERLDVVYSSATRQLEAVRNNLVSPKARLPQLPPARRCKHSNDPTTAMVWDPDEGKQEPASAVVGSKQAARDSGIERIHELLGLESPCAEKPDASNSSEPLKNTHALDLAMKESGMVAVVHADGNGVGKVFMNLWDRLVVPSEGEPTGDLNRRYVDQLRRFSLGLELLTERAFRDAYREVDKQTRGQSEGDSSKPEHLYVVPLVLGGDDVTFVADAKAALPLTKAFVERFLVATSEPSFEGWSGLSDQQRADLETTFRLGASDEDRRSQGFGMGAGIAAVHRHFPVFTAYHLAEELTKSAKLTKQIDAAIGAIDFHVLFDSTVSTLDELRDLRAGPDLLAHGGPYLVGDPSFDPGDWSQWCSDHQLSVLVDRLQVEPSDCDDGADLEGPSASLMHQVRETVDRGTDGLDSLADSLKVRRRTAEAGVSQLNHSSVDDSFALYRRESTPGGSGKECSVTTVVDLIDVQEIGGKQCNLI